VIPKFVRKKFAGVQQPLGRWILRHVVEFIVLSPAILVTWLWLKIRRKEILIVGRFSSTISMFVLPLEPELRRRKKDGDRLKRTIVLNLSKDANIQVRKMFDRVVKIYGCEAKIQRRIVWWASLAFVVREELYDDQSDLAWLTHEPTVSFTFEEEKVGEQFLAQHGLSKFNFVCYTVRSESYYLARIAEGNIIKPQTLRNPSEATYLGVANCLVDKGFPVLRMGKDMPDIPNHFEKSQVINYSKDYHTDFLDVYLLRYCKFLFSGNTGIISLRWLWNAPSVTGDSYLIWRNQIAYDIFLLQRVWLERENRFATFREMLLMPGYSEEKHQERLGVRLVKNTAEEIKDACDEMNARVDGTWVMTEEDEALQSRYQELIVKYSDKPSWNGKGRIGAQFLRDNQDLLR
jgi:putative glycosyltransferase (TIGR04372 family)